MTKIINRTNSPYDLAGVSGNVRLPAFGEVEGEFSCEYLDILAAGGLVTIEDSTSEPKPSEPVEVESHVEPPALSVEAPAAQTAETETPDDDVNTLKEAYRSLSGKEPDKRWAEKRLRSEIDKLKG